MKVLDIKSTDDVFEPQPGVRLEKLILSTDNGEMITYSKKFEVGENYDDSLLTFGKRWDKGLGQEITTVKFSPKEGYSGGSSPKNDDDIRQAVAYKGVIELVKTDKVKLEDLWTTVLSHSERLKNIGGDDINKVEM